MEAVVRGESARGRRSVCLPMSPVSASAARV